MKKLWRKSDKIRNIEGKEGMYIEEVLRHKFVDENKPTQQIADELGISYPLALKLLKSAGIYSRKLNL